MKTQDLRVGNLINLYDDFNAPVTGFTNTGRVWFVNKPLDEACAWHISKIKGIPLTEQWIQKLGFKHYADGQYILFAGRIEFNWDKETGIYIFEINSADSIALEHIKHVHQLQNLYYSLTDKELVCL